MGTSTECSVDGCKSNVRCRGWCNKHYNKWRRYGDPKGGRQERAVCSEVGCTRWTVGQGWCETHYARFVRAPKAKAARAIAKADAIKGRECAWCGGPIPVDRRRNAMFCSVKCKHAEYNRSGRQRESALRSYYRRQYGLSWEDVEAMRTQGCGICGAPEGEGRWGQLHIDHCHDTGIVRGVLCNNCNTGLGHFRSDSVRLAAAIAYLEAPMT